MNHGRNGSRSRFDLIVEMGDVNLDSNSLQANSVGEDFQELEMGVIGGEKEKSLKYRQEKKGDAPLGDGPSKSQIGPTKHSPLTANLDKNSGLVANSGLIQTSSQQVAA